MKIIELLNIVADNTNVPPKKIKFDGHTFEYKLWISPNKYTYVEDLGYHQENTFEEYFSLYDLNKEVEVINE